MSYSPLLRTMFDETDEHLSTAVAEHLANGEDPNTPSEYGETPLMQAFRRGRQDVFTQLVAAGADIAVMKWTGLHQAVALGEPGDVEKLAAGDSSTRDKEGPHTIFAGMRSGRGRKSRCASSQRKRRRPLQPTGNGNLQWPWPLPRAG